MILKATKQVLGTSLFAWFFIRLFLIESRWLFLGHDSQGGLLQEYRINALPPVHINSSWQGNQWIPPPGYRLYSSLELQQYFSNVSVLMIGDSTARRSYATFYALLQGNDDASVHDLNHPSVIDVNKLQVTEPCNDTNLYLCRSHAVRRKFDFYWAPCLHSIKTDLQNRTSYLSSVMDKYDVAVFALGPWEVMDRYVCGAGRFGRINETNSILENLLGLSNTNQRIIWRTWGGYGSRQGSNAVQLWNRARAHNGFVKTWIDKNPSKALSYLDWGEVIRPRSFPDSKRIAGDNDAHFGLEARLTFIQMLVNHLKELDRQEKFGLPPFPLHSTLPIEEGHYDEDGVTFMNPPPDTRTPEEKRIQMEGEAQFCPQCLYGPSTLKEFEWRQSLVEGMSWVP